jgi:hypothetical protein
VQTPRPFEPQACPTTVHAGGKIAAGSRLQNFMLPCDVTRHTSPAPHAAAAGGAAGALAEPCTPEPAAPTPLAAGLPAIAPGTPPAAPRPAETAPEPAVPGPRYGAHPPHSVVIRSAPQGMYPVLSPPAQMQSISPADVQTSVTMGCFTGSGWQPKRPTHARRQPINHFAQTSERTVSSMVGVRRATKHTRSRVFETLLRMTTIHLCRGICLCRHQQQEYRFRPTLLDVNSNAPRLPHDRRVAKLIIIAPRENSS